VIEAYSFGNMVINGQRYGSDIIIYPDGRIQDSWWRETGHSLSMSDIADLVDAEPEIIIAGTGESGLMKPDVRLEGLLSEKGIEFRTLPSWQAMKLYNNICRERKVGACFHLFC